MAEVLRLARDAMVSCRCNEDPDKDGCYRCLYQYRLRRAMEQVSRDRAVTVLNELLGAIDQLERVKTISDIFINPNFDSPLEARFIEALRRLGGKAGLPAVKLVQDVVNGKSGYVLEVGGAVHRIEPQLNVVPDDGVAVASRPDFVIWPAAGDGGGFRPVAVFCDGWAFHKDVLRADAAKRSALAASGRFRVLSVTHEDVMAALAGDAGTDLESPLTLLARHDGAQAPAALARPDAGAFQRNAVAMLLRQLDLSAFANEEDMLDELGREWAWLTYLMLPAPAQAVEQQAMRSSLQAVAGAARMDARPARAGTACYEPAEDAVDRRDALAGRVSRGWLPRERRTRAGIAARERSG